MWGGKRGLMEIYLWGGVLFISGATAAGAAVSAVLNFRQRGLRRVFEVRLGESEKRVSHYREELQRSQQETLSLKESIEKTKRLGGEALAGIRQRFQKKILSIGMASLTAGLFLGGTMTGVLVNANTRLDMMARMVDLEVTARTSKERALMYEGRLQEMKKEYDLLRKSLLGSRESEAVAAAKLEILLDHLASGKARGGLMLDIAAMRENLRESSRVETQPGREMMGLPQPAAF